MAFFGKVGSILRQTASGQICGELSASKPSIYQAIRCMSSSKLFVGGLSYSTDDQSLKEAFSKYGYVAEARVILDRETGRSRGFGFVTYSSSEEASSAIQALDGQDLHGRRVRVNYAADRRSGGFGGGGGYGGNYGGNYGNAYGAPGGSYGGNNASYGGGSNYGSGGNYGSGYGGGNANYEGAGNYSGGNTGGFSSSNYGVAGGGGGADSAYEGNTGFGNFPAGNSFDSGNTGGFSNSSDNFNVSAAGGNTDDGYDGNTGIGGNQFGSNETGGIGGATEGFDQDRPLDGNYRDDDDDTDNFAKRV